MQLPHAPSHAPKYNRKDHESLLDKAQDVGKYSMLALDGSKPWRFQRCCAPEGFKSWRTQHGDDNAGDGCDFAVGVASMLLSGPSATGAWVATDEVSAETSPTGA